MYTTLAGQFCILSEVQQRIQDLHPILEKLYPVAVADGDQLFIYTPDPEDHRYRFAMQAAAPMSIPPGVRAAFPLDCFANRMACVVTGEVFDSMDGVITIFHEFIHCYQFESCELSLKNRLAIARSALADGDFMWELNYPFPYTDPAFSRLYAEFLVGLDGQDLEAVLDIRRRLKQAMNAGAYEYMLWQEWKEGFARFLENQVRARVGEPLNFYGEEPPFSRVAFYAGGAGLIKRLAERDSRLLLDLGRLFESMQVI